MYIYNIEQSFKKLYRGTQFENMIPKPQWNFKKYLSNPQDDRKKKKARETRYKTADLKSKIK